MKDQRDPQTLGEDLLKWKQVYPNLTFSEIYDKQMAHPILPAPNMNGHA